MGKKECSNKVYEFICKKYEKEKEKFDIGAKHDFYSWEDFKKEYEANMLLKEYKVKFKIYDCSSWSSREYSMILQGSENNIKEIAKNYAETNSDNGNSDWSVIEIRKVEE